MIYIGTAGWAIPRGVADAFPTDGTGLQRYAARFDSAEINSTFYRAHRPGTLERWADAVPDRFRFSVKLNREIIHTRRLVDCEAALDDALSEAARLGERLGPLLLQLPPSLAFAPDVAAHFLEALRARSDRPVALEPRHAGWFTAEAEALLTAYAVARVGADPARAPTAGLPGGWPRWGYLRLHGSPQIYRTPYGPQRLADLAERLGLCEVETWCIFDNTMSGAAAADALELRRLLGL